MPDYNEALKRPFSDLKKLILGLVISVIPIVNFIASGYHLKCASSVVKTGKRMYNLPKWSNWGNLFLVGLVAFVISLVYFIPAILVAFFAGGRAILNDVTNITYDSLGFSVIVVVLLALFALYVLPMALTRYAIKENFKQAFDYKEIFRKSLTWKYLAAWIFSAIVVIILTLVMSWIRIPIAGTMINFGSSFANYIGLVIAFTLFGRVYGEIK